MLHPLQQKTRLLDLDGVVYTNNPDSQTASVSSVHFMRSSIVASPLLDCNLPVVYLHGFIWSGYIVTNLQIKVGSFRGGDDLETKVISSWMSLSGDVDSDGVAQNENSDDTNIELVDTYLENQKIIIGISVTLTVLVIVDVAVK